MMDSVKVICKLSYDNYPATCRYVVCFTDVVLETQMNSRVPAATKYPVSGHCREICPFLNS